MGRALRTRQAVAVVGCGSSMFYLLRKRRHDPLPKPTYLGPKLPIWDEDELIAWRERQPRSSDEAREMTTNQRRES